MGLQLNLGKKPLPSANKHPSRSLGPPPSPGCFPACRCLFLQEELGCGEGSPERGGQDKMGGPSPLPRWAAWGRPWLCQDGGAGPGQRVFGQVGAAGCTTGTLLGVQMWCWSPDLPAGHSWCPMCGRLWHLGGLHSPGFPPLAISHWCQCQHSNEY